MPTLFATPSTFSSLQDAISPARLRPYQQAGDDEADTIARYLWNAALCESFYAPLQHLEVTLRNNLHEQIAGFKRDPLWLDENTPWLATEQANAVSEAKTKLARQGKPLTTGHLIAELPFSFWTGLLRAEYEQNLWPRLVVRVFPGFPPNQRARAALSRRLNDLRHLRNHIFHHEPLWNRPRLGAEYEEIIETIGWMNPAMKRIIRATETFPHVFAPEQLGELKALIEKEF